jgi:uncharacterized protein (TIGR00375 family)
MQFAADLHIHSRYSRAVSLSLELEELDRGAGDKGIEVLGTGDFTHPRWLQDIREKLEPAEPGLFKLQPEFKHPTLSGKTAHTRFLLSVEISCIYRRGGKTRRVHNLVFAPSIPAAEQIVARLARIGNLRSDGRPILGLDSEELLKIVLDAGGSLIPAHAWTPWFSVFGSMSGFDSLEEAFGENAEHIFAIETGLSSDPAMNWRWSKLDSVALISNSDAHSAGKLGRELNLFDAELSYGGIMDAIRSRDSKKFVATVEFFPEEGKYHYDGHRGCGVSWSPEETRAHGGKCSACGRNVTRGVLGRVDALADRTVDLERVPIGAVSGFGYEGRVPFARLVPLQEIVSGALHAGLSTKKVRSAYEGLVRAFGSELEVLLRVPAESLASYPDARVSEAIIAVRNGNVSIVPGFDGEFGKVRVAS